MFKVGTTVKCINNREATTLLQGGYYTIREVTEQGKGAYRLGGTYGWFNQKRFTKIKISNEIRIQRRMEELNAGT